MTEKRRQSYSLVPSLTVEEVHTSRGGWSHQWISYGLDCYFDCDEKLLYLAIFKSTPSCNLGYMMTRAVNWDYSQVLRCPNGSLVLATYLKVRQINCIEHQPLQIASNVAADIPTIIALCTNHS